MEKSLANIVLGGNLRTSYHQKHDRKELCHFHCLWICTCSNVMSSGVFNFQKKTEDAHKVPVAGNLLYIVIIMFTYSATKNANLQGFLEQKAIWKSAQAFTVAKIVIYTASEHGARFFCHARSFLLLFQKSGKFHVFLLEWYIHKS